MGEPSGGGVDHVDERRGDGNREKVDVTRKVAKVDVTRKVQGRLPQPEPSSFDPSLCQTCLPAITTRRSAYADTIQCTLSDPYWCDAHHGCNHTQQAVVHQYLQLAKVTIEEKQNAHKSFFLRAKNTGVAAGKAADQEK
ncbi:uncharacterized protein EHS24_005716 [Apiotrichum porosum]|uniref:Uncharacterized protein n=1 Tax=Apiotrichum porosum TaxID=105984 RepID=A0A427XZG7_9TREE|nr:uncharacterized protein EHS24_005716 [Apiotrichum porosum]RSH84207.1 hypothetical protein EHS24_005716 [Apiotrichum porosum]